MSRTLRHGPGRCTLCAAGDEGAQPSSIGFFRHADAVDFVRRLVADPREAAELWTLLEADLPPRHRDLDSLVDSVAWGLVTGRIEIVNAAPTVPAMNYAGGPSVVEDPSESPSRAARRRFAAANAAPAEEEEEETECGCSVAALIVRCDHGGREAGPGGVLQVVASRPTTDTHEVEWGPGTAKVELKHGGEDPISVSLELGNVETDACGEISVSDSATPDWKGGASRKFAVPGVASAKRELWPRRARPVKYHVAGRGHDGLESRVTIEAYPEHQRSVEVSLKAFEDWVKKVNKGWEKWASGIFSLSPVEVDLALEGPSGSFSATWGWQESNDWQAYFGFEAELGLSPILGVEITFKVSVMKIAASAAGMPPPLPSLMAKHLADIYFFAGGGCDASLKGSPKGKFFASGARQLSGSATFSPTGYVKFGLVARVGSDYVISVSLRLQGKSTITGEATVEIEADGLFVEPTVSLTPFVATCTVKLKAFKIYSRKKTKKWQPWKEDVKIYEGKRTKLLPR